MRLAARQRLVVATGAALAVHVLLALVVASIPPRLAPPERRALPPPIAITLHVPPPAAQAAPGLPAVHRGQRAQGGSGQGAAQAPSAAPPAARSWTAPWVRDE